MNHRPPSLRSLALLLTLPVLLLAGMGVWVVRGERERVESELRQEARRRLDALLAELPETVIPGVHNPNGTALQNELASGGYFVPQWLWLGSAPPPPGKGWDHYQQTAGLIREGRLAEARDSLEGVGTLRGFSPSGIPLAVLYWRLKLDSAPAAEKSLWARSLSHAAAERPCDLTSRIIRDALTLLPAAEHAEWEARIAAAESVLNIVRRRAQYHGAGLQVAEASIVPPLNTAAPGEWAEGWLARTAFDGELHLLSQDDLQARLAPLIQKYSATVLGDVTLAPVIWWHGGTAGGSYGKQETVVSGGRAWHWQVVMSIPSRAAVNTEISRRNTRLIWMISAALLATASAMWITFRAFKKQAELSRLQSEFVASVSHELRTPVASIGVLAERLEGGKADAAQTAEYHRFIAREGRRLAALVDNVLDFSRIERGARAYDLEHADLPRLVRETAALMRPHAEEKGLTLTEEIEDVPEHLWPPVDAVALRQALVNLLDNAVKFTPSGGTVTVKFSALGRDVMLHVRDTGIGIPPSEHARIFERFHRVDNGLRRETTGAGIGLSIVKHIAEAHGARVTVASEAGRGAVFTIHFKKSMKDEG